MKSVLVVDENSVSLKLTAGLVQAAGFSPLTAETAEQAVQILGRATPSLVITSLRLPGLDGIGFTRTIKQHDTWKSIPVILLTAAYSAEEEREAVAAGCECALPKPLDVKLFPGMIALFVGAPAALPNEPTEPQDLPMQELREEFLSTSAEECQHILSNFADQADLPAIKRALHAWAGVGGTLGYPRITHIAREMEALIAKPTDGFTEDLGLGLSELLDLFLNPAPANSTPDLNTSQTPSPNAPMILVADDDSSARATIQRSLESAGYRCRVAGDGATAFAMARTLGPSAIVLDINMPEMDGFQVLYSLRKVWNTRFIPVLMLTASHEQADVMRGGLLGASDYMTKPFDVAALVARVDRLLSAY